MFIISRDRYTKTPSSGAVTWNTNNDMRGILGQVVINPSVATTTYDFIITNDAGTVVYKKDGLVGTYVDDSKLNVYGIYTCNLSNTSTSSYAFTVDLIWEEPR
jgi:hypothetical protein